MGGFEGWLGRIVEGERAAVNECLQANPLFASATIEKERFYAEIPHWIYKGDTPLHAAAAAHQAEIAALLLAAGAEVNASNNRRRSRPLHYACDGCLGARSWSAVRQVATIRLLLKSGAELHARDANGATGLHRAVRTRSTAAVKILLEAGADPQLRNKPGSTPFHLAVQNTGRGGSGSDEARAAQREIIALFLAHGLSPGLRDGRGKSVRDWASNDAIRRMLA